MPRAVLQNKGGLLGRLSYYLGITLAGASD